MLLILLIKGQEKCSKYWDMITMDDQIQGQSTDIEQGVWYWAGPRVWSIARKIQKTRYYYIQNLLGCSVAVSED